MSDADLKPCPMCGEMIRATAVKCRFCGEHLTGPGDPDDPRLKEMTKRVIKENQDKSTALQLLITGIIGCFSPILAIYGTIFLLLRPYPFERKGMAIAGTILHWVWTVILIGLFLLGQSQARP